MTNCIVGCDPGLASFGIAEYDLDRDEFIAVSSFSSKPSAKKLNVLATSDNVRRARDLHYWLTVKLSNARGICTESMSIPRAAGAAWKVAIGWGIFISVVGELPIVQASPMAIKKAACGDGKASKEKVQEAMIARHPELESMIPQRKGDCEHAFDAAAAVEACLPSDIIKALRRS